MTLTRIPRLVCSGVMLLAPPFLVLIPAIIKLERPSRVCALGHLVLERTARTARCVYGALVIPSQSDRVPPPTCSGPASYIPEWHTLLLMCSWGCHETQGALGH